MFDARISVELDTGWFTMVKRGPRGQILGFSHGQGGDQILRALEENAMGDWHEPGGGLLKELSDLRNREASLAYDLALADRERSQLKQALSRTGGSEGEEGTVWVKQTAEWWDGWNSGWDDKQQADDEY